VKRHRGQPTTPRPAVGMRRLIGMTPEHLYAVRAGPSCRASDLHGPRNRHRARDFHSSDERPLRPGLPAAGSGARVALSFTRGARIPAERLPPGPIEPSRGRSPDGAPRHETTGDPPAGGSAGHGTIRGPLKSGSPMVRTTPRALAGGSSMVSNHPEGARGRVVDGFKPSRGRSRAGRRWFQTIPRALAGGSSMVYPSRPANDEPDRRPASPLLARARQGLCCRCPLLLERRAFAS
jgi:hypothetical protein